MYIALKYKNNLDYSLQSSNPIIFLSGRFLFQSSVTQSLMDQFRTWGLTLNLFLNDILEMSQEQA